MFPANLGRLGNAAAIWLGIQPWELFFYIFLPPLLLDAAVRTDWFMFKKVGCGRHRKDQSSLRAAAPAACKVAVLQATTVFQVEMHCLEVPSLP